MVTACPQCSRRFQVDPSALGKEVRCPSCGTAFAVTAAPAQPPAAQAQVTAPPAMAAAPQPVAAARAPAAQYATAPAGLRLNGVPLPAAVLVGVGLLLVVASRGSDAIGARGVARAAAKQQESMRAAGNSAARVPAADSDDDPRAAARDNMSYGYWREWLFLLGTLALTAGLLWTGFATTGAPRWFSFGGLGIIIFSLYIGGMAWMGSIASAIAGVLPRF